MPSFVAFGLLWRLLIVGVGPTLAALQRLVFAGIVVHTIGANKVPKFGNMGCWEVVFSDR